MATQNKDGEAMTRPGILPIVKFPDDVSRQTVKRECSGAADTDIDDQGNEFERCPDNDHGHLYLHGWCLHCFNEKPEKL